MTSRKREVTEREKLEMQRYREYAVENGLDYYDWSPEIIDEAEPEGEWSLVSDPTF
jgi:hypothetical protein